MRSTMIFRGVYSSSNAGSQLPDERGRGVNKVTIQSSILSDKCSRRVSGKSGKVEDYLNAKKEERCWYIRVPKRNIVTINVEMMEWEKESVNGLIIAEERTGFKHEIRYKNQIPTRDMKFGSDVTVTHYAETINSYPYHSKFRLSYNIEKGFLPSKFGDGSLEEGVSWLRNQSSEIMSWKEDTPRAVVALFLGTNVTFDGTDYEEELMANQVELRTAVTLLKPTATISELSMLVNALLVTCYDPHKFHKMDVVQRLKTTVQRSRTPVHPVAYLALCNANETWPERAIDDLDDVLNDTSSTQSSEDMKAMAVMALSCYLYHKELKMPPNVTYDPTLYDDTTKHFKTLQFEDGSFGNVYTTALIAQALIADMDVSWSPNATVKYLQTKLNSSMNFLTAYLVLPILNGKTLVDLSVTNCSAHPRKHAEEIAEETKEVVTPIMQIKYSLFYGDKKEVIQATYLGVPVNSTAYYVMEQAEAENPKYYTFERKTIRGAVNVFEISGIPNDPESGNYWMLFTSPPNRHESIAYSGLSPNNLILKDGQHLVMWYRSHRL